jgi:hypothetical protein
MVYNCGVVLDGLVCLLRRIKMGSKACGNVCRFFAVGAIAITSRPTNISYKLKKEAETKKAQIATHVSFPNRFFIACLLK